MDQLRIAEVLDGLEELAALDRDRDLRLDVIRTAIALEDSLGIVLPDDVIDEEHLGTRSAILALLAAGDTDDPGGR